MPRSEKSGRALATAFSIQSSPTVVKIGVTWQQLVVGLLLCETTQIEQELAAV
jgi:hypothetical protein